MSDDDDSARDEVNRHRAALEREEEELSEQEREQLKARHWMRCPKCGMSLTEITFRGVKIDKCFSCGGVYLDDGELEQLAGKPGWFEAMRLYLASR